ncbi:MAG: hypothetical protein HY909_06155 [Deltaproteobacteria bacterium]|nr:hypothetical protein [Deltaproteobacteria bacterium]
MGSFGLEFVNARESSPGEPTWKPYNVERDGSLLIGPRLREIMAHFSRRSGYVYFPPGTYLVDPVEPGARVGTDATDLYVPPTVTMIFSPGAVLRPTMVGSRVAVIQIHGGIEAGPTRIFDTAATARTPVGRIFLTSNQIPVVYPEWWGAAQSLMSLVPSEVDTAALQAAFDAAHNDRHFSGSGLVGGFGFEVLRPTIPIALRGPYLLRDALYLGQKPGEATPRNPDGFILRGSSPVGSEGSGRPTLVWDNTVPIPSSMEAMLVVRGSYGFTVEDVSVDAGTGAASTHRPARGVLVDGMTVSQMNLFRRCTFLRAARALVQLGPPPPEAVPSSGDRDRLERPSEVVLDAARTNSGGHDLYGLRFEGCNFLAGGAGISASPADRGALQADGVVFRANQSFGVEFDSCAFGGHARAMLRAFGGSFLLTACVFHTLRVFDGFGPMSEDEPLSNGCDVVFEVVVPERMAGGAAAVGQGSSSFTAVGCESQSWRFLLTHDQGPSAGPTFSSVITNLHHAPVADLSEAPLITLYPPAIVWRGPARRGAKLLLDGCLLQAGAALDGRLIPSDARVLLGTGLPLGSVVSIGTRTTGGALFAIDCLPRGSCEPLTSLAQFG